MYHCRNCDHEFENPLHTVEKHGLGYGPYQHIAICPVCRVADIEEIEDEENDEVEDYD